jgi:hypothetical protein
MPDIGSTAAREGDILPGMKTKVLPKGRVVLPAKLLQRDGIKAGQALDVERLGPGEYRLKRRPARPNEGVIDWLLACPEKGFFVAIDSESTEAISRMPASAS